MISGKRQFPSFVLLILMCFSFVVAQDPTAASERRALIKELLELTGGNNTAKTIIDTMLEQQNQTIQATVAQSLDKFKDLEPAKRERLTQRIKAEYQNSSARIQEILKKEVTTEFLLDTVVVPVYSKYYTDEDLKSIVAFYKSPAGKKMVEVTPQLVRESMQLTTESLLPKVYPAIERVINEQDQNIRKIISEEVGPPKSEPAKPPGNRRG
jgi:uncharacterized protein